MKLLLILWVQFAALCGSGQSIWTVGEKALVCYDGAGVVLNRWVINPRSWSFDADACRVWVEGADGIFQFSTNGASKPTALIGSLVSDVLGNSIFLREGNILIRADRSGMEIDRIDRAEFSTLRRMVASLSGYWSIHRSFQRDGLWLMELGRSLKPTGRLSLSEGVDLWGVEKLFSGTAGAVWIGFTASTPKSAYSPVVALAEPDSKLVFKRSYHERGIFFDGCVYPANGSSGRPNDEPNDEMIVARDIPSNSGFTVPVQAYLEKVNRNGVTTTVYSAETNWLIESLSCHPGYLWMVQRSMFGSDRSRLMRLNFQSSNADWVADIADRIHQIYSCEGEH